MKINQHVLSKPKKFVASRKILIFVIFVIFLFLFSAKTFCYDNGSQNLQLKNVVTFGTC